MGENFFDQPIKYDAKRYENIIKVTTCHEYHCRTNCILNYSYFKENCKLIAIDVSKQQALDADPKVI